MIIDLKNAISQNINSYFYWTGMKTVMSRFNIKCIFEWSIDEMEIS